MTILLVDTSSTSSSWHKQLKIALPEFEIRLYPDVGDIATLHYAVAWAPPHGLLAGLPNLKLTVSLGAGVDHLLQDPTTPLHVPIVRLRDPKTALNMREYLLGCVLAVSQNLPLYIRQREDTVWERHLPRLANELTVGILGLGWLGTSAATAFVNNGYTVLGWTLREKRLVGVACLTGVDGLDTLLGCSDLLICLLPLTPATKGFLNNDTFDKCKKGVILINVARGQHLVEEDLLASLNSGRLSLAIIDVFKEEPLPSNHPFWKHERIILTPHVSGIGRPEWGAECVARYIRDFGNGVELADLVNRALGY